MGIKLWALRQLGAGLAIEPCNESIYDFGSLTHSHETAEGVPPGLRHADRPVLGEGARILLGHKESVLRGCPSGRADPLL